MATKYERALVKLENADTAPLFKVHVDYDAAETERERERHMRATRGRGSFVVIPAFAADL
jgi:hypothetical protein